MTTILCTFIIAFAVSIVLTPAARWLGVRFGAVDVPSPRKVHTREIPRSGGVTLVLSFFLALVAAAYMATQVSTILPWDEKRIFAILGGIVVFAVGFFDDFHRLGPRVKFLFQIFAASLAFYGGVRIEAFVVDGVIIHFGILSWFVTVLWFLLFINAMNLIDGLDGLAAGVAFFTSAIMVILAIMQKNLPVALEFAALGGALLGFLRYNFNPASIFLGDGGTYFIGYAIAAISILGSIKSQMGATLLIPLLALGVPIFDAIFSPLRRWFRGRGMFRPDRGHIHHRLLGGGLSSRKSVLILYVISCLLCAVAILLVNLRDVAAGMVLVVLGAGAIIFVRKLGYLDYFAADKVFGWLRDMLDITGLSQARRSFLNLQIEIDEAKTVDDLWVKVCLALEMIRFDRGELHIYNYADKPLSGPTSATAAAYAGMERRREQVTAAAYAGMERRREQVKEHQGGSEVWTAKEENCRESIWVWARGHHRRREDVQNDGFLRVELPLGDRTPCGAKLVLIKNLTRELIQPYILRRVENLRRSVNNAIKQLKK